MSPLKLAHKSAFLREIRLIDTSFKHKVITSILGIADALPRTSSVEIFYSALNLFNDEEKILDTLILI